jgi:hypothetical protein
MGLPRYLIEQELKSSRSGPMILYLPPKATGPDNKRRQYFGMAGPEESSKLDC